MRCPVDNETLVMADRNGVEIDYCPKCRGVWLDRGELDKIIDRATPPVPLTEPARPVPGAAPVPQRGESRSDERRNDKWRERRDDDDDDRRRPRRRESFLSDLFDF